MAIDFLFSFLISRLFSPFPYIVAYEVRLSGRVNITPTMESPDKSDWFVRHPTLQMHVPLFQISPLSGSGVGNQLAQVTARK